ncbi:MAG: PilZ domain-containing protein [Bacteriovoracia bacterium]
MPQKPQFFEIKDESIVAKVMDLANRHSILLTMWTKDQSVRFETQFVQFFQHLKRMGVQFPVTMNEIQFNDAFSKQGTPDIMGSFQLENVNFFFKTEFMGLATNHVVQLTTPKSIFKMQRRSNLRIPFPRLQAPKLTMFDPRKEMDPKKAIKEEDILAFRIVDLSVGGLGIAAKPTDREFLPKGIELKDLRFKLRGQDVVVSGIVRHFFDTTNDKNEPMIKVGIEFKGLQPKYERIIAQFVLEESRKLFSLFY